MTIRAALDTRWRQNNFQIIVRSAQGNLLKGIDNKTDRRQGLEPIKRVFTNMCSSQQHTFYKKTKWIGITFFPPKF